MFEQRFNFGRFNTGSPGSAPSKPEILLSFNGRRVSECVKEAQLLDLKIGAPAIQVTSRNNGHSDGDSFVRTRYCPRSIEMQIELPLRKKDYDENFHAIRAWASSSREPAALVLPVYKGRMIKAVCTSMNEFDPKTWWLPVILKFTAYDPFFEDVTESSAQTGEEFIIRGDAAPEVIVRKKFAVGERQENPMWRTDGGRFIQLVGDYTNCDIEINYDVTQRSTRVDGANGKLTLDSRYSDFQPGKHVITGPAGSTIEWHERWL